MLAIMSLECISLSLQIAVRVSTCGAKMKHVAQEFSLRLRVVGDQKVEIIAPARGSSLGPIQSMDQASEWVQGLVKVNVR